MNNNTKSEGISIIMIFKIGPLERPIDGEPPVRVRPARGWWARILKALNPAPVGTPGTR
jgi:hypothetical protein